MENLDSVRWYIFKNENTNLAKGPEDLSPDELEILEAYKERITRSGAEELDAESADSQEE